MKTFGNVIIVGVGLIGASIGMNLVKRRLADHVVGVGRGRANLNVAKRRRAIHQAWSVKDHRDLFRGARGAALKEADLIILATPVKTAARILAAFPKRFIAQMKQGAVITDVGSTKRSIMKAAEHRIHGPVHFVGAHPIAGTEQAGAQGADPELFKKCLTILTPGHGTPAAQRKVKALWRALGSRVLTMPAGQHDRLLSLVSHLPHMNAYSLVQAVGEPKEMAQLVAGGFRDITRIASSDPVMWRDICVDNADEILKAMRHFDEKWRQLKQAIRKKDGRALQRFFESGKRHRDHYS